MGILDLVIERQQARQQARNLEKQFSQVGNNDARQVISGLRQDPKAMIQILDGMGGGLKVAQSMLAAQKKGQAASTAAQGDPMLTRILTGSKMDKWSDLIRKHQARFTSEHFPDEINESIALAGAGMPARAKEAMDRYRARHAEEAVAGGGDLTVEQRAKNADTLAARERLHGLSAQIIANNEGKDLDPHKWLEILTKGHRSFTFGEGKTGDSAFYEVFTRASRRLRGVDDPERDVIMDRYWGSRESWEKIAAQTAAEANSQRVSEDDSLLGGIITSGTNAIANAMKKEDEGVLGAAPSKPETKKISKAAESAWDEIGQIQSDPTGKKWRYMGNGTIEEVR